MQQGQRERNWHATAWKQPRTRAAEPENSSKENEVIEVKSTGENQSKKLQGGYECKYCPYSTQNLNEFTEHVDMQHPNVILNPLYACRMYPHNQKYDLV